MTLLQSAGGRRYFLATDVDRRMGRERRVTAAEGRRGRPPGRRRQYLVPVGRLHDQRAEPAHLRVQEADCVVLVVVGRAVQ
jgi:hypothetical protein